MDSESLPPPPPPPPPPRRHRPYYPDYTKDDAGHFPWKYTGNRVFTRWVASDQAFSIVRRFGTLNTRGNIWNAERTYEFGTYSGFNGRRIQ